MGVPIAGCECPVCLSNHPQNVRLRPSLLIEHEDKTFVIDMGPDFREQALKYKIKRVDGVLVTHTHYDHIAGFDEIRPYHFRQQMAIPILLASEAHADLGVRFYYFPDDHVDYNLLKDPSGSTIFEGVPLSYFSYMQAGMRVVGYRFDQFAYVTDIQDYNEDIFDHLNGVDTLVLSALRWTKSRVHFTIDDAIAFGEKAGVRRLFLTHIAHDLDHDETNERLPKWVRLAYDGLQISV
ncbi:MAG: Ribonuclease BN [Chlamydiia bacterium]|nr:Ribonuclease BN [Chlamydiia bacterium]MCH9615991.1 Ribonuclease BN [Chlamydiia bacterium]MCH9629014.1 Ribonuclease BN [Chlamydiia bacterium]